MSSKNWPNKWRQKTAESAASIDSLDDTAEAVTAFTRHGLDYLEELFDDRRSEFMKDA